MSQYKKKVRNVQLQLDPHEKAIVVTFDTFLLDLENTDHNGEPTVVEQKAGSTNVRLKSFKPGSNVPKFAAAVIKGCKYISDRQQDKVERLLHQLDDRLTEEENGGEQQQPDRHVEQRHSSRRSRDDDEEEDAQAAKARAFRELQERMKEEETHAIQQKLFEEAQANRDRMERDRETLKRQQFNRNEHKTNSRPGSARGGQRAAPSTQHHSTRNDEDSPDEAELERKRQEQEAKDAAEAKERARKRKEKKKRKRDRVDRERAKLPKAKMSELHKYKDALYLDDMDEKVKGTGMLLQLVNNPRNLEELRQNKPLVGALGRLLQEDSKRSIDLTTNILEVFFRFSTYSQLHEILIQNRIGNTALQVIDLELKRYDIKYRDKDKVDPDRPKEGEEPLDKKGVRYLEKQERLLFICFYILLNMAEDTTIEYKMKQRKLIPYLCDTLSRVESLGDRDFLNELFILVTSFLKKLSVFSDNKHELIDNHVVERLVWFLQGEWIENVDLLESVLRLLFNLSFDAKMRQTIISSKMLDKFVEVLKVKEVEQVAVRVMYNLSMDRQLMTKQASAYSKSTSQIMNLILTNPGKVVDPELIALGINLSLNKSNVSVMAAGDTVSHLIKRVHASFDPLLLKLIRNISEIDDEKQMERMTRHLHELCKMSLKAGTLPPEKAQSFLVECLGTIANIAVSDVRYADLLNQQGFLESLTKNLVPGMADDDVVLETIRVLITFLADPECASYIGSDRLVVRVLECFYEKNDDVEIVFHLTFLVYKLLLQDESREVIMDNEKLVSLLLDLCIDRNDQIRHFANLGVDIVCETSEGELREKILARRFETTNYYWLEFLNNGAAFQGGDHSLHTDSDSYMTEDESYDPSGEYGDYGSGGLHGLHARAMYGIDDLGGHDDYDDSLLHSMD